MTLDLSGLENFAAKRPVKVKPEWAPLLLEDLHPGTYLACDQSLRACGVVLFEVFADRDRWSVHMAQKFAVEPTEVTGWEDILRRVATLEVRLRFYVDQWIHAADWGEVRAVHEAPPIGHGKLSNPEISLITAYAYRRATEGLVMLPMVRRQDHARLICGKSDASKTEHHRALRALFVRITGSELVTNEATRDALSVALMAAKRGF